MHMLSLWPDAILCARAPRLASKRCSCTAFLPSVGGRQGCRIARQRALIAASRRCLSGLSAYDEGLGEALDRVLGERSSDADTGRDANADTVASARAGTGTAGSGMDVDD